MKIGTEKGTLSSGSENSHLMFVSWKRWTKWVLTDVSRGSWWSSRPVFSVLARETPQDFGSWTLRALAHFSWGLCAFSDGSLQLLSYSELEVHWLNLVVHTYNLSVQEAVVRRPLPGVQGQPGQFSEFKASPDTACDNEQKVNWSLRDIGSALAAFSIFSVSGTQAKKNTTKVNKPNNESTQTTTETFPSPTRKPVLWAALPLPRMHVLSIISTFAASSF